MPLNSQQKILVRGVNWLGDAVMSTPALQRLREAYPGSHITLLTHEKLKDLWVHHPALDAVQTFAPGETVWRLACRLRASKYDLCLVFPNSPRSALEVFLAGIPRRIGYAYRWRNWLLTQRVQPRADAIVMHKRSPDEIKQLIRDVPHAELPRIPATAHHTHQYLHLAAALGASSEPLPPRLRVPETPVSQFIARFKLDAGQTQSPLWFGLNAGAEYGPAKRWPEARFTEAAIQIQRRTKCRWLVFGLKSEWESAQRITTNIYRATEEDFGREAVAQHPHVINLAGATSLRELCAGLKFCRVLLTNDSGPMHVAAAVGTAVVVPFGSTSPELTGPGMPGEMRHTCLRANAPCSPCFLRECPIDFRCMNAISVERVVEAVIKAAG